MCGCDDPVADPLRPAGQHGAAGRAAVDTTNAGSAEVDHAASAEQVPASADGQVAGHVHRRSGMGFSRRSFLRSGVLVAGAAAVGSVLPAQRARASVVVGRRFYRIDPHVHCVVSGDAVDDVGILQTAAGASPVQNGYDAIFISDHHLASRFTISGQSALSGTWTGGLNNSTDVGGDPAATKWTGGTYPASRAASSYVTGTASAPALTGKSLHLMSTSTGYAEAFAWYKRGPNLYSTGKTIQVSVWPVRVDANCAIYVSASIGGDATVAGYGADGFTLKNGYVTRPGQSKVLVWQLGTVAVPLGLPQAPGGTVVFMQSLGAFTPGQWNTFSIHVDDLLATALATDTPLDANALTYLKMAVASAGGGTVEAYFDSWTHSGTLALSSMDEFVNRNLDIANLPSSAVSVMPAVELGLHDHVQRLNFRGCDAVEQLPVRRRHPRIPKRHRRHPGVGVSGDAEPSRTARRGRLSRPATGYHQQRVQRRHHGGLPARVQRHHDHDLGCHPEQRCSADRVLEQ